MNHKYVIKLQDIYILTTGFWILSYMLHQTGFDDILPVTYMIKLARVLCYAYFCVTVFRGKIKKRAFIGVLLVIGVTILSLISSENTLIIDTLIIIISARNNNIQKIIKKLTLMQMLLIFIIVLASFSGLIPNAVYVRATNGIVRQGLGFKYATYSANYFFHAVIAYVAFNDKKIKIKDLILFEIINIILYYYTNTAAVFIELTIALILYGLIQLLKKPIYDIKVLKCFFDAIFPVCSILPFILTLNYNAGDPRWLALNTLLTSRLSIGSRALTQYPITLFGQVVQWYTGIGVTSTSNVQQYIYVDSSFLNIAITYGILILIIVVIAYCFLMRKAVMNDNKLLCVSLAFLAIHSMTDPQLLLLQYNVILIAFAGLIVSGKSIQTDGRKEMA